MNTQEFFIVFIVCAITMLICRVTPLLFLQNRELPEKLRRALGFIPAAAFAALVANDLFNPSAFTGDILLSLIPFCAAFMVILCALKTKSLIACVLVGVCAYALLTFCVGLV